MYNGVDTLIAHVERINVYTYIANIWNNIWGTVHVYVCYDLLEHIC